MSAQFFERGWMPIGFDQTGLDWARHAHSQADQAMRDPALAQWWDCEDTWFIGVDALRNDDHGVLPGGPPLHARARAVIMELFGEVLPLHRAQLSVMRPGYPRPRRGEGQGAFRYRLNRDAAHVDGLKPFGPNRERRIDECHEWILGLPLTQNTPEQSPMVVWEGSHHIIRDALKTALAPVPRTDWGRVDITAAYQAARRIVFETCPRVPVLAAPGEGYLVHRLALHGVAPWGAVSGDQQQDRMVAFFRPDTPKGVVHWLLSA
ncbi:hypothetical protein [Shimia abyssi]|uniref:Phytanoyl-CoA dioxygenase PhyH n=1 Tax=Shimia abyssi TaxID=1662395 RepID=A0A2P8FJ13_9RHOB|nr:hypothetical protein [Shimia abyssi]PSL21706.1 hypothetical protein CLV88_101130 [Shimia abyssi]